MATLLISLLCLCLGIAIGVVARWIYAKSKLTSAEQKAQRISDEAVSKAEAQSREILLETRDKLLKEQQQQEREARERRFELQKSERRLLQKEENLDHRQEELEKIKQQLGERDEALGRKEKEAEETMENLRAELEREIGELDWHIRQLESSGGSFKDCPGSLCPMCAYKSNCSFCLDSEDASGR